MKYAIIRTGGKQYKISEGDIIGVERLGNTDKAVTFSEVLLYTGDGEVWVGTPFVTGVSVTGTVLEEKKQKKIRVAKFKSKVRFRRVTGHRQILSMVQIETIGSAHNKKHVITEDTERSTETQKLSTSKKSVRSVTVKKASSK